jgi:hypothetical protein
MGTSVDRLLTRPEVTELIAFELEADLANLYADQHPAEPRLQVEVLDAHATKPSGTFDLVLYELPMDSRAEWLKGKQYLSWAWGRLNSGGHIALPAHPPAAGRFSQALASEFPALDWFELAARVSIKALPIWRMVRKP